jgi:hypothetical protein
MRIHAIRSILPFTSLTHILPVDPHDAERVLDLVGKKQIRLTPAAPPRYDVTSSREPVRGHEKSR